MWWFYWTAVCAFLKEISWPTSLDPPYWCSWRKKSAFKDDHGVTTAVIWREPFPDLSLCNKLTYTRKVIGTQSSTEQEINFLLMRPCWNFHCLVSSGKYPSRRICRGIHQVALGGGYLPRPGEQLSFGISVQLPRASFQALSLLTDFLIESAQMTTVLFVFS
jgi:hypothetical protein